MRETMKELVKSTIMSIGMAFVLWACFMGYYRAQAQKMNEMIQKMNR